MTDDEAARMEELIAAVKWLRGRLETAEKRYPKPSEGEPKPKPQRPMTMKFGKHKGKPVRDLPTDYAQWLLNEKCREAQEEGRFAHPGTATLVVELAKVVHKDEQDQIPALVTDLAAQHKRKYRSFDDAAFLDWLHADKTKGRVWRCFVLGVAFMNQQRQRQVSYQKGEEYLDDLVETGIGPGGNE